MVCLKDPQTRNTIHPEPLMVEVIRWNKVAWVFGNSKTRRTLRQQLTIIYCSMFRLYTVALSLSLYIYIYIERERERKFVRVYEQTQRDTPTPPARQNANFWLLFQNSLIFIYLNSGYWWGWCHLAELLRHFSRVPNSLFSFLQSNLSQTRYESILFTFWLTCVVRYVLA